MPRTYCQNCRRPSTHCLCSHISEQCTSFPLVICQHPDESSHPFTTSQIAALGASSVQCLKRLDVDQDEICSLFAGQGTSSIALLYSNHSYEEHESYIINFDQPESVVSEQFALFAESVTGLIVLDGTWRNTREIMLRNAWLTKLPTLTLKGLEKSMYHIRKTDIDSAVSTVEAVGQVLKYTERRFDLDTYLMPLKALVEAQQRYQSR